MIYFLFKYFDITILILSLILFGKEIKLKLFIGIILFNRLGFTLKKFTKLIYDSYDVKILPILGRGARPKGATMDCHPFVFGKRGKMKSESYGMPSGHSISAKFALTYISLAIKNGDIETKRNKYYSHIKIFLLGVFAMYVREDVGCHTKQQTRVGSVNGIIFAFLYANFSLL